MKDQGMNRRQKQSVERKSEESKETYRENELSFKEIERIGFQKDQM